MPRCVVRIKRFCVRVFMRLALAHSANFGQDELGDLAIDVVLEPGDLLYFPRGFTHQVMLYSHSS